MLLKNKFYTVMVVPSATSRVQKFKVSSKIVNGFIAATSLMVVVSGVLCYDYIKVKGQVGELDRLRVETRDQRLKINSFAQQLIDVEKEMTRLRKFDAMLRGVFELDKSAATRKIGGIGGGEMELSEYPEILEGKITELSAQIDKDLTRLKSETSAQEASLSQLTEYIQEKRSLLLSTPSIWPTRGLLTSGFQKRTDPVTGRYEKHTGLDIATNEGSPIVAPADGVVTYVTRTVGFGKLLGIDHGYGFNTMYAHNSRIAVKPGQRVMRGQVVAYVGSTGKSTGPHLHYEIYKNGIPVNPSNFILN
jgi:murein DD-endopeptidase MepM/ murein hydrolase activator NlpD